MTAPPPGKSQCTIAVIGASGVGKTAFIMQFTKGIYGDYDPQIDDDMGEIDIDGTTWTVHALEGGISANDDYEVIQAIRKADGVLLLYGLDAPNTLEWVDEYFELVLKIKDVEHFPMVLVGTKSDRPAEVLDVTPQQVEDFVTRRRLPSLETSARTSRTSVQEAVATLIKEIRRYNTREPAPPKRRNQGGCTIS